jgi:uncharacterized protein DUF6536
MDPSKVPLVTNMEKRLSRLRSTGSPRNRWSKPGGWRVGILIGTTLALLTLVTNVSLSAITTAGGEGQTDITTLFEGDCEQVRRMNIGAHFVINLLSALLLGVSNYAMQCMLAPTRAEVDRAHAIRQYLNIGVMSPQNLFKISRKRAILWLFLTLSSLPLHLLYDPRKNLDWLHVMGHLL